MRADREPVFKVPGVVLAIIAVLGIVQLVRQVVPVAIDDQIVVTLAFVPLRFTAIVAPHVVWQHLAQWAGSSNDELQRTADIGTFFLKAGSGAGFWSLLTYALLHGNWTHLGLNGVWLLAFGTPVARRFGPARFLAFMTVAAVAGALFHWALFPVDVTPLVGASAAVSGCMGAAVRFAFRTPTWSADGTPVPLDEGLRATLRDRRAVLFLAIWFVTNAVFGLGATAFGFSDAPVAWQAHVGGLLVGVLGFSLFAPRRPVEDAVDDQAPEPPLVS